MERRRPSHTPTRPLVLIADGHEDTLALYALGLSAMGFDVLAAKGSTNAYSRAWELRPDIIVTDLALRQGDGWELLQRLKGDARTRDIPVVAVSAHVQPSLLERTEREGFAAFFPKPFLPGDLAAGIRQVLDGQTHAGAAVTKR